MGKPAADGRSRNAGEQSLMMYVFSDGESDVEIQQQFSLNIRSAPPFLSFLVALTTPLQTVGEEHTSRGSGDVRRLLHSGLTGLCVNALLCSRKNVKMARRKRLMTWTEMDGCEEPVEGERRRRDFLMSCLHSARLLPHSCCIEGDLEVVGGVLAHYCVRT